jgi:glutamate carboxypeptidase
MADLPAAADRLAQLVELESPSGDVPRLAALCEVLANRLAELGGQVTLVPGPAGDHIHARFRGADRSRGHLLLIGHYDTVCPAGRLASCPFVVRDGWARGPGALDMKGGLVALELALGLLGQRNVALAQPVEAVLVADEEVSSPHGRHAVLSAARGAAAAIGLEPAHFDGALKNGRRGVARVRIEVTGREAHAGLEAGAGTSAIDELVDQLHRLPQLLPTAADFGYNAGTVSGGSRANVVAGRAAAELGLRFGTPQTEQAALGVLGALAPIRPGAAIAVTVLSGRPAWPATPGSWLVRHVQQVASRRGQRLAARPARGAGDANLTAAAGVPTIDGLGPRGRGAHSPDETVELASITGRAELLAALLATPLPGGASARCRAGRPVAGR